MYAVYTYVLCVHAYISSSAQSHSACSGEKILLDSE